MKGVEKLICGIMIVVVISTFGVPSMSSNIIGKQVITSRNTPQITIFIHEIVGIDPIESIGQGDPDWYYYVGVSTDGGNTWDYHMSDYPIVYDQNDLIVDTPETFNVNSLDVLITIELCEQDPVSDDFADISSDSDGGVDNAGSPVPFGYYGGNFKGELDLKTNSWRWSDQLGVDADGYWITSGNYDGSTSTDENDAEIHFTVWDNYEPPVANAGPDKTVEIGNTVSFDGSRSTASNGSEITTYQWDLDGDGNFDSTGVIVSWRYTQVGRYTVTLKVTDNMGVSDIDTCIVNVVDTVNPTISIASPNDGDILNTQSVTIYWSGSDFGSGIDHYEIKIDSDTWKNVGTASSYTFTSLSDGTHTVYVKAVDVAGNEAIDSIEIIIDTEEPSVAITSPRNDSMFNSNAITIHWTGSDSNSGIDHYEIQVDSGSWNNVGMSTSYTISSLTDGSHTVYVKAIDKAGNSAEDSVSFTVDTANPSISITSPSDGAIFNESSVTVDWTGSDSNSGIDHYEIQVDSGSWSNVGASTSYTVTSISDGTHTITVKAIDKAGNSAKSSISIMIDTQSPNIEITSPSDNAVLSNGTVTIKWTGLDANSGIDHYEIKIDNGNWINFGKNTTHSVKLSYGTHTITVKAVDKAGNSATSNIKITIKQSFDWLPLILGIVLVIIIAGLIGAMWKKKGSKEEKNGEVKKE